MAIELGSRAASLGSALGSGIAQGGNERLDFLMNSKLEDLHNRKLQQQQHAERQRYSQSLTPIVGQQAADFLSNLAPKERERAFENLGSIMELFGQNQNRSQHNQQGQSDQPSNLSLLNNPQNPQQSPGMQQTQNGLSVLAGNQPQAQPGQEQTPGNLPQQNTKPQALQDLFTSPKTRMDKEKFEHQKATDKETLNLRKEANEAKNSKEVREFNKPYLEKRKAGDKNKADYKHLMQLAEKGDLYTGKTKQILDTLGLGNFITNYDTQVASKIISRLAQNVSGVFGSNSRVTNYLESVFQRSLPALWNTKEGIVGISKLNLLSDELNDVMDDTRQEVLKENGYKLPPDIDDVIYQRARPKLEKIEQKMLDLSRDLSGESKSRTVNTFEEALAAGAERIEDDNGKIYKLVDGKYEEEK